MRMSSIGKINEFKLKEESVAAYLKQMELFFAGSKITEADKLVTMFLSVVGTNTYTLLRGLVAPGKPKDKSFLQLVEVLKKHYEPTRIVIIERFYSHHHGQ